jgi:hypothetical protein
MICPLLRRIRWSPPDCPMPGHCPREEDCLWARFHEIDPITGKPRRPGQPNPTPPPKRQLELL